MSLTKIDTKDADGKIVISAVFADGSGEPDPDRKISKNEQWYDKEIAPALSKLAKKCHKKNMAFGAIVEYNPGEEGRTTYPTKEMSNAMWLGLLGIKSGGNIDKVIMGYEKVTEEAGVDLKEHSIYLRLYHAFLEKCK